MAEESEAFEQHVTLFDGVLATSKPLESQQLDRVLVNVRTAPAVIRVGL